MNKHLLLVAVICLLPSQIFSQVIEWQNTIGGADGEYLYSHSRTMDGGYILGGFSDSYSTGDKTEPCFGFHDYWIVKIDSLGIIQWQNNIGGIEDDNLHSVRQTSDGGYILGGISNSNISGDKTIQCMGSYDYWIVKTDSSGNILWQKVFGGDQEDFLNSILQTADGGYIFGGTSYSDMSGQKSEDNIGECDLWVVKTDSAGNLEWQNTIGGSAFDFLRSITMTNDGGYVLGGYSNSNISGDKTENCIGAADYWMIKIDSVGIIKWQNTIGGNSADLLYSVLQIDSTGFLLAGYSYSDQNGDKSEDNLGLSDYWILKTDTVGKIIWQNTIGGNSEDKLYSALQSNDAGFIIGGTSRSNISGDKTENCIGSEDYWIVKTDSSGILQWENTIGGDNKDYLYSIEHATGGGYNLAGYSFSDISGDKTENSTGTYDMDYWIIKINESSSSLNELLNTNDDLVLYPNPTKTTLTIETGKNFEAESIVIVSDVTGRIIFSNSITTTSAKYNLDISFLSRGIYFVQVEADEKLSRGRFVKE